MSADLTDRIRLLIAEHFGIDLNTLRPETQITGLGIDSLAMIEFMFEMEEKFNIRMADSRAPLLTVADVVSEIQGALRKQTPAQGM